MLALLLPAGAAHGQVMVSPAFQEEAQAKKLASRDPQPKTRTVRIHAADEPDPALRYRLWPAPDKRRHASPHPFFSRAILLATQAMAQDRNNEFPALHTRFSEMPLDQLPSEEVQAFLDRYAMGALNQLSEIDGLAHWRA